MLELWGMQNTPSLPLLWPGVVATDRLLTMGKKLRTYAKLNDLKLDSFDIKLRTYAKLNFLK